MSEDTATNESESFEDEEGFDGEAQYAVPEGYETVSSDVAAYWEPKHGPLFFIPQSVRLMDNTEDPSQSSCLILGTLNVKAHTLTKNAATKRDRVQEQFEPGTIIGVWAKAGMRDLINLGRAHVWMAPNGKREMPGGGRNAMQLFMITRHPAGPKGETLELIEDSRKSSLSEPIDRDLKKQRAPWYLAVLPDGGMEAAREAWAEKSRLVQAAGSKGQNATASAAPIT